MKSHGYIPLLLSSLLLFNSAQAKDTQRIKQFTNHQVSVWETVVYPSAQQKLAMHRHDHDRVVVALTDGLFKITNDKGKIHYLKLEKNKAYYLARDPLNELHNDENMSDHAIRVMVVELNTDDSSKYINL
jgi:hypothetical protein